MVNTEDTSRPDHFPSLHFAARDLPTPRFSRAQDIRGGNSKLVRSVAWSCDGEYIATGTEFKGLRIWDARSTVEASSSYSLPSSSKPSPHAGHVAAIAFSPVEPRILVSGCKSSAGGAVVAIWDIKSPSSPISTHKISGDVLSITFHPSGSQFAVVCPKLRDEVYFFWKVERDGKQVWEPREDIGMGGPLIDIGSEEINSLRFSNSGKLISAVSNDGSITSWLFPTSPRPVDVSPQLPSAVPMDVHERSTSTPASPVVEAGDDSMVGKSRVATPREGTPEDENHEGEDKTTEMNGENGEGRDGVEHTGDIEGDASMVNEEASGNELGIAGVTKDSQEGDGDVEMEEAKPETNGQTSTDTESNPRAQPESLESAKTILETPSLPEPASVPAPAPSRRPTPPPPLKLSSSGEKNAQTELEAERRKAKQLKRFRRSMAHSASLLSLSYDPSGRFFCVGGQDALLSLFDTRDWIVVRTFDVCTAAIRHSAFSPDGELIAVGGDDNFIAIVSVFSGTTIAKVPIQGNLNSLAWHPVNNILAYSTSSKTAIVWHLVHQE